MIFFPTFLGFFREKRYRILTLITFSVLIIGILGFRFLEGWEWLDCINYAVSIMVTTGNAEVYPQSDWGKIFNVFYMFLSVILILFLVNTLYQHFHSAGITRVLKDERHKKIVEKQIEIQENEKQEN